MFLFAAGIGFFLAIVLAFKSQSGPANKYLSLLLATFSISILYYITFWTGMSQTISPLWGLILTLPTLYGVLLYAFTLKTLCRRWTLWHYLPFTIHFVYMACYYGQSMGWWNWYLLDRKIATGFMVLQNTALVFYTVLIFKIIQSSSKKFRSRLTMLTWFFAGFVVSHVSYYMLVWTIDFQPIHDYFISISMCSFMFLLGYWSTNSNFIIPNGRNPEYSKSGLSSSMLKIYSQRLTELMTIEKPYRNGDLKLADLAAKLEMSPHNLSEIINRKFDVNFSEFLNGYRIEEALNIMQSQGGQELRLIDIAYQTGFNNKTSFSQTFKKVTNFTPSEFRAQLANKPAPVERS